ncbi:MAG: protein kinase [Planctomyces sp.]|nr:protein kinase [Planctomyces sp.]
MSKSEVITTSVIGESAPQPSIMNHIKDVAGYQLVERVGLGGYGEVWSAIGPGGFRKAVKILFGAMNGPQAETELKSLQHMRELRHPFLLSIERIEIIEDRLIVVTELADSSLDKRFQQCVAAGARGIPRDELLGYLRDAADALDFMTQHHGLQHLDIKPENLLIQGNHVKVGDFGLAKHIGNTAAASIVRGFTPLYSPPELFEGNPSRTSDQYSLAIVYQILLTGTSPFSGRTAAQLTAQHLKSTPDLTPLSPTERGVVSRALSKNPSSRFPGCRQFIDELSRRRPVHSNTPKRTQKGHSESSGLTQVLSPNQALHAGVPHVRNAAPLSPPDLLIAAEYRPTLFVAVGGLGIRIAEALRSKLAEQFGTSDVPSFGFVYIDSDKDPLNAVLRSDSGASATLPVTTVPIPLRSTHDYRKSASEHLSWISRRWLFNIPRNGHVEGMRPLGRLAYIDHQAKIRSSIKSVLTRIGLPESIAASTTVIGGPVSHDNLDICLIGSVSGGTSSGCLMDIAYTVRGLSGFTSFRRMNVSAMLVHSTSVGQQHSDTHDANAASFLKELLYYSLPGNATPSGIPAPVPGQPCGPFDSTMFVHLGDDLTNSAYSHRVEDVAEYLHLWCATEVRRQFETWRKLQKDNDEAPAETSIRTFGHAAIQGELWADAIQKADSLTFRTVKRWLDMLQSANAKLPVKSEESLRVLLDSMHISEVRTAELIPAMLRGDTGRRIEQYSADLWNRITKNADQFNDLDLLMELLTNTISADASAQGTSVESVARIAQSVRQELAARLQNSLSLLSRQLTADLDDHGRLYSATITLTTCRQAVEQALVACQDQKEDVQEAFSRICGEIGSEDNSEHDIRDLNVARSFTRQYCMLLLCQTVAQCVIAHLTALKDHLERHERETLAHCRKLLRDLVSGLSTEIPADVVIPDATLESFESWITQHGHFKLSTLTKNPSTGKQTIATLSADAMNFLLDKDQTDSANNTTPAAQSFPANAHPVIRNVGGSRRVLAILPKATDPAAWKSRLEAEFGPCVATQPMQTSDVSVYCELESIPIPWILETLTSHRPRVAEISERVHARNDVAW